MSPRESKGPISCGEAIYQLERRLLRLEQEFVQVCSEVERLTLGYEGSKALPDFLTKAEAAKLARCHPSTIDRWASRGLLTKCKVPGAGIRGPIRILRNQLLEILQTSHTGEL